MATFHPDPGTKRIRRQGAGALVFFGLALVMFYLPAPQQQEVAALLRATALRPFIATQEMVARARVQSREMTDLRREMDSLISVLANQTTLVEENQRLRKLLGLDRRIGVDYRAANLLRPGTEGSESMFLLDVERGAPVHAGAPVIAPEGLVGVVREIGPGGAIGMDWTHPDFRASAMTVDGTTYGIVEPNQEELRGDRLLLTGTPFTTRLEPGTRLVTSGRGGVYPRGIPIGIVEELAETEGGWRTTYAVQPAVELGTVTHVLVGAGETVMGTDWTGWTEDPVVGADTTALPGPPAGGIDAPEVAPGPADTAREAGPDPVDTVREVAPGPTDTAGATVSPDPASPSGPDGGSETPSDDSAAGASPPETP